MVINLSLSLLHAFVCFMLFRHFRLIPNRAGNCGLFIYKDAVDSEDFFIKLSTDIKTSDGEIVHNKWFDVKSNEFKVNEDLGLTFLLRTEDIFNVQKKYLAGDALTFNINVTLLSFLLLTFINIFGFFFSWKCDKTFLQTVVNNETPLLS
jgi:hypothetical protein